MVWSIWNQRNKVRVQAQPIPLHQIAEHSRQWLQEFYNNLHTTSSQPRNRRQRPASHWHLSPSDFVKINFDGAMFLEENKVGIGVVIRDQDGLVMVSCARKLSQAYKAEDVEAMAAIEALKLAHDLGFRRGVLEGDSLVVIEALKAEENSLAPLGLLIQEAKVIAPCFDQLLFSHVKREGNFVAYSLAKYAICIPDFQVWMEDVLSHILSVLQTDLIHLQ